MEIECDAAEYLGLSEYCDIDLDCTMITDVSGIEPAAETRLPHARHGLSVRTEFMHGIWLTASVAHQLTVCQASAYTAGHLINNMQRTIWVVKGGRFALRSPVRLRLVDFVMERDDRSSVDD